MTTEPRCAECLEKWGQVPSAWGDSVLELDAYQEHAEQHASPAATRPDTPTNGA